VRNDVREAPHLVVWAVLAGCMWSVANTLTIYAIRNVGLSIAFPLWNTNSLLGIFWGFLLFNELHYAGWKRWLGVIGGAVCMFRRSHAAGDCIFSSGGARQGRAGRVRRTGCRHFMGDDVYPLSQSVSHWHESAFLHYVFYSRRTRHHDRAGTRLSGRDAALARTRWGQRSHVWLMLGGFVWVIGEFISAVRHQIRRHQPRHSAFQHQSTLGIAVGHSGFS